MKLFIITLWAVFFSIPTYASTSCSDTDVNQLLMRAVLSEEVEVAEWLIKASEVVNDISVDNGISMNVNCRDNRGFTPLIRAVVTGNEDMVDVLLDNGAIVNVQSSYRGTALMHAAERGFTGIVETLIAFGADVNIQNQFGETALMIASEFGKTEVVDILIEEEADVHLANEDGDTALTIAAKRGHADVVDLLSVASRETEEQESFFAIN